MTVLVPQLQLGFLSRYLEQQRITEAELREKLFAASEEAEARIQRLRSRGGFANEIRAAQLGVARIELAGIIDETYRGPVERAIRVGIGNAAAEGGTSFFKVLDVLEGKLGKIPGLREAIVVQARRGAENLISRGMNNIPLSRQVYRTGALAKDQLHRMLDSHLAAGSSWSELARDAKRFISPFTPGGAGYAAKRLARTELNNAFHSTQIRTTLKNPFVEGYRWQLSGSHPRPDQCNVYADWGGTGIFSKANVPGKPHPNCLCFLMYDTPSVEEFQKKFLEGGYDDWLDSFIEENVPHLSSQLKQAIKARPQPSVKRVQGRAGTQRGARRTPAEETPQAALERVKADPKFDAVDEEIARLLNLGRSIRDVGRSLANHPGLREQIRGMTTTNLETRMRKMKWPYEKSLKYDRRGINNRAMTAERRAEINESLDDFQQRYPERTAELREINSVASDAIKTPDLDIDNTFAYYRPSERNIYLNGRYYRNNATMKEATERSARTKFHPVNCSHEGSVFDHEFGHHLDYGLSANAREELLLDLYNAFQEDLGQPKLTLKQLGEEFVTFTNNVRGDQAGLSRADWFFLYKLENKVGFVSEYAETNSKEFIAELVSEFRAPRQSRYSKIAQRIFDREMGRDAIRRRFR